MNSCEKGFTLLEVLIALTLFTIIASVVSLSLYSIVNSADKLKQHGLELANLQSADALLARDILQIIDRPIIDEAGQEQPAVQSLAPSFIGIEFTKIDNLSPLANLQQSNLQRVGYFLRGSDLYRQTWPILDRIGEVTPNQRRVLSHVSQLLIEYIDANHHVHNNWPLKADDKSLPKAIIFKVQIKNQGRFERTFVIVGRGWQEKEPQP